MLISLTGLKSKSFSLQWRGSRDGSGPDTFHQRCDGKSNTLTLIKNKLGYMFGAYTAVPWSSTSSDFTFKSDSTAFLFTLTNPSNNPLKLNVIEPVNAVIHHSCFGPMFGYNSTAGTCDFCFDSFYSPVRMDFKSYESPNGRKGVEGGKYVLERSSNKYKTLKIEIFQVI